MYVCMLPQSCATHTGNAKLTARKRSASLEDHYMPF